MRTSGSQARLDHASDKVLLLWPVRALLVAALTIGGCAAQATGGTSTGSEAPGGCRIDTARICADSLSAGTLESPPPHAGYTTTQSVMPDTARVSIPNGPTLQVMCYYDQRHKSLDRSDWTASGAIDAAAAAFLKSKNYCAAP
jgi:hypothetical protein